MTWVVRSEMVLNPIGVVIINLVTVECAVSWEITLLKT